MASDFSIRHAAHLIKRGGVIAYPTDTIYGLGCDPYNPQAIKLVNNIKQRPLNKQFILLAANIEQIKPLLRLDTEQEKTITQTTQAISWVVEASKNSPAWLIDHNNTVTIRISHHPVVKQLCNILGHPIISTSANPSGKSPARNSLDLHKYFHHLLDKFLVLDQKQTSKASKIIRLCDNYVIRN